jgi:tetratricopeptide (TPR) repeat protein
MASKKRPSQQEKQLHEAAKLLDARDFTGAEKIYRALLKRNGNAAPVLMGLAMALNHTQRFEEALLYLQRTQELWNTKKVQPPAHLVATLHAQMGFAHEQTGNLEKALEHYHQAIAALPTAELQQRVSLLTSRIKTPSSNPAVDLVLTQAEQLQKEGRHAEAFKHLRAAYELAPNHPPTLYLLAWAAWRREERQQAIDFLQDAALLAPDNPIYLNDLAMFYHQLQQYEKAVIFYQRALQLQPNFIPALVNLGAAYKQLGQLDNAAQTYFQALKINPNQPELHNNLGNLLRLMGQTDDARAAYKRALQLRPDYVEAKHNLESLKNSTTQKA